MNKVVKAIVSILLLFVIAGLAYAVVQSVMEPVKFNKAKDHRQAVAVQRLKDIRDLQVAYKTVNGKFTKDFDSLAMFYNTGKMEVVMQIGSNDDSLAVANTEALKKANRNITPQQMYELYKQGQSLVFAIRNEIPVKDTLFHSRTDFNIDSLKYIPFSGNQLIEMDAIVKQVSGVNVPLFEAKIPWKKLLKGLDNQLRINLDAEEKAKNKYEGLQVGSISAPNNNAGNWE